MLSNITQNDAEYTAAIAVDGKRDSIAMRTISILGIVYLPPTFVATLFSVDMFDWGPSADGNGAMELRASPSVWIYCAVAVPLTLATFLVWMLWARKRTARAASASWFIARGLTSMAMRFPGRRALPVLFQARSS
jgi:Mg2+ and Co2+ transporter CorA